jgi:CheY-like chemotaxis protein
MESQRMPKILIVEDEMITARDLEHCLTSIGCQVVGIASSAEEAIAKVGLTQPDLILMDIVLAGPVDGVSTTQRIQSQHDIPVIYVTAYSDAQTVKRAMHSRPYGYVVKPFKEEQLRDAIGAALERHRSVRGEA